MSESIASQDEVYEILRKQRSVEKKMFRLYGTYAVTGETYASRHPVQEGEPEETTEWADLPIQSQDYFRNMALLDGIILEAPNNSQPINVPTEVHHEEEVPSNDCDMIEPLEPEITIYENGQQNQTQTQNQAETQTSEAQIEAKMARAQVAQVQAETQAAQERQRIEEEARKRQKSSSMNKPRETHSGQDLNLPPLPRLVPRPPEWDQFLMEQQRITKTLSQSATQLNEATASLTSAIQTLNRQTLSSRNLRR